MGNTDAYEVVAVIEYQGNMSSTGDSVGHYNCDIKDKVSGMWFRTNDNNDPVHIEVAAVSVSAYVVLYKKLT